MNLFEQDIVLPGVVTEIISDYSSGYDTSLFGTTDSVAVIGTAFNGPVGRPVEIYSPEHARYVFGAVYDSKTRTEATLVANIQDAWDRGCRTIYAVRISGKDINKDYQLGTDTNLKLRMSGIFPSNSNKDVYMAFNDEAYEMNIQIFKPAQRATINEKKHGMVESQESVLVNKIDLYNGGISKDDELLELIKRVNEYSYNNVIRLSIVDDKGNDVTLSSMEAKALKVGDMFPGIYTVGRVSNANGVNADTKLDLVMEGKPYESYEGRFYKKLTLNTNVAMDIPVFSEAKNLHTLLGISAINQYDFLTVAGKIDEVFLKDKVDYEEVGLNEFDLYKKLGSGYAVNAQIVEVAKDRFKVKEVIDKSIKKTEIKDGMYSMLENLTAKYRVLCGASADSVIKGKLPKSTEFKFARAGSVNMLNDTIEVQSVVDNKDLTKAKSYEISFAELTEKEITELETVNESLFTKKTIRQATAISYADMLKNTDSHREGSLFLVSEINTEEFSEAVTLLYSYVNNEFKSLHEFVGSNETDQMSGDLIMAGEQIFSCSKSVSNKTNSTLTCMTFVQATAVEFEQKKFAVLCIENGSFLVVKFNTPAEGESPSVKLNSLGVTATILGTVESVLNDEEDKLIVSLSSSYGQNKIAIKSNQFDYLTIDEVVEMLNEDKDFAKLFNIKVLDITKAQDFISEVKDLPNVSLKADLVDRKVTFDTNLLVPFRTDDNFGRHLAQHCMYTSLKTSPTHGIMGTRILLDMGLESIANRVKDLVELRLDTKLVAKKSNGTDMLDKNNMPYPIGRKLSVIAGQYPVTTNDNYTFISNMAAGYAGMISCLPLDQSSTCQPINIPGQMYELTNYQLSALTSSGFVTVKKSYSKGWVITDGITMATPESAYRRLSSSRIADGLEDIIRRVCEPYIGKQNHLANQNSLRSAIKSDLDKLKDKLIESYDFKLLVDRASAKLGIINIEYSIVPIYEIKVINNSIKITD